MDLDGDLDIFVGDFGANLLFYNLNSATDFTRRLSYGDSDTYGVALGDLDGDLFPDVFVANGSLRRPNEVWMNTPASPRTFRDSFQGLGNEHSEAVALGDLDGDGDLDAFVVNGAVNPANQVWLNDATGAFTNSGQALGDAWSRAVALGDLDGDGDLDAFVGNDGPDEVWLNNGRTPTCQCVVEWLNATAQPAASLAARAPSLVHSYQQAAHNLLLFYRVRDRILGQTPAGQHYIDLYYAHDPEMLALLAANTSMRDEALATLDLWQPQLQALVDGQGGSATITAEQVAAADSFLNNLALVASPALQEVIVEERARLGPLSAYAGMTVAEARGSVVGYGAYLPMVAR